MSIIDRYKGESVRIGNDIKVTVLGRQGDEVRLGIEAPRTVKIIRTELKPKPISPKEDNESK